MKKVAIVQSNYIPWKGYFSIIVDVDEFIFYDDMQYTRSDWSNRNQLKTAQGVQWLTVPFKVKGKYHQFIRDTEIDGADWASAHWKAIMQSYRHTENFEEFASIFELPLLKNYTRYSRGLILERTKSEPHFSTSCSVLPGERGTQPALSG